MNISLSKSAKPGRQDERGFIVIALLVVLSILLIYVMVNLRYLNDLKRELRLFEREQIKRLQKPATKSTASSPVTNLMSGEAFVASPKP